MTATIHDFPLSNQKADRAFWKGIYDKAVDDVNRMNDKGEVPDTAPAEFNSGWVQDSGDCA